MLPGEIERDQALGELSQYHGFVADYRRGATDGIDVLLRWDNRRLQRVLASIDTDKDARRPWDPGRFRAAAMMHTDAALQLLDEAKIDPALVHLEAASRLLKQAGDALHSYVGRWHQAMAGALRLYNWLPAAERFLASGRQRWPDDAQILYESAILQELLAGVLTLPTVVNVPDFAIGSRRTIAPRERNAAVTKDEIDEISRERASRLNDAARWLEQSVKRDPSNIDARLHLGRVQMLRQQDKDALEHLGRAAASGDPAVSYLALLFTGALHGRSGRQDDAVHAYRAAIGRYPRNHAAHVGLSAVLQRTGRADEARAVLATVVDAAVASRRDPWWTYASEPWAIVLPRLERLRREARQ